MIAGLVLAAVLAVQPVEIQPATVPIRVDARLDEAAWADAVRIPVTFEWYPSDNTAAPVETDVMVTYDERNLYVGFHARDPQPSRIRARYHERDAAQADDLVGFYVDPLNDDRDRECTPLTSSHLVNA